MEQNRNQNLNETNVLNAANKKNSVKINGQVTIESNKQNTIVPLKPARTAYASKPNQNGSIQRQMDQSNDKSAPVANTAETDEIEFLLDEIQDLEVPACRTDSEQDFEIAGSHVDLDLSLHLDSPIDTSWYYFSNLSINK